MKKIRILMLTLALLCAAALPVGAEETNPPADAMTRAANQCGESLYWEYANGVLTITGSGSMDDYEEGSPWSDYQEEMTSVVIEGDVTYIGAHAFQDFDALVQVDFGDALYEIGTEAFRSCDGLTVIYLPASFKIFGESCFQSCRNLTEIHCEGVFPSFRLNSLWDTYATIYFPAERPWSVELIQELEEAFSGRIEFLASDGSDPYDPTAETEASEATETTSAAEPETTEAAAPETAPETTPETTGETVPETTETVPQTTAPEAAEAQEEESGGANGLIIGSLIVCGVLILAVLGALIFRRGGGGKYAR